MAPFFKKRSKPPATEAEKTKEEPKSPFFKIINSLGQTEKKVGYFSIYKVLSNEDIETVLRSVEKEFDSPKELESFLGQLSVDCRKRLMISLVLTASQYPHKGSDLFKGKARFDLFKSILCSFDGHTTVEVVCKTGVDDFIASGAMMILPPSHLKELVRYVQLKSNSKELEGVLKCLDFPGQVDRFRSVVDQLVDVLVDIAQNDSSSRNGKYIGYKDGEDHYGNPIQDVPVYELLFYNRELACSLLRRIDSEFSLGDDLKKRVSRALEIAEKNSTELMEKIKAEIKVFGSDCE